MDVGVLQKGSGVFFIKASAVKKMEKRIRTCKIKFKKPSNCSELYLIYFHALLSVGRRSSGGTARRAFTFGLI